jgi:hypothetical protein
MYEKTVVAQNKSNTEESDVHHVNITINMIKNGLIKMENYIQQSEGPNINLALFINLASYAKLAKFCKY